MTLDFRLTPSISGFTVGPSCWRLRVTSWKYRYLRFQPLPVSFRVPFGDIKKMQVTPRIWPASPVLLHPQTSEAFAGGKRRNSHQSTVFGKAGNRAMVGISKLAAGEGFEPSHTESESAVLPLHKPAVSARISEQILLYRKELFCQVLFSTFRSKLSGF